MEKNKRSKTKYEFTILRPGGNDTMLIKALIKNPTKKKLINNQMMSLFPNVEQVGFYDFNPQTNIATLEMAGGEFCGNATRSLAYLLLNGKNGQLLIQVSGTTKTLRAGVKKNNTAFAEMPIYPDFTCVRKIGTNMYFVDLEGISHFITPLPFGKTKEELKEIAKNILMKNNFLYAKPATGVMFVQENSTLEISPIVWVRDIQSFFYETACASGTMAVGLWKAKQNPTLETIFQIKQPSGAYISGTIRKSKEKFLDASIDGPIQIIEQKNI